MLKNKVIYVHYNANGVFYVGIGNSKRPYTKSKRSEFWNNHVNKHGCFVKVIETGLTSEDAQEKEIELIDLIGRRIYSKGNLVNISEGGQKGGGRKGYKHTKAAIDRISKAGLGRVYTDKSRKKMSDSAKKVTRPNNYYAYCEKKVINIVTNETYVSIGEAAELTGIKRRTLNAYLSGQNPNKTDLRYIN